MFEVQVLFGTLNSTFHEYFIRGWIQTHLPDDDVHGIRQGIGEHNGRVQR